MNDKTIVTLKGPDRVRKRPAVIFGSEGADGAINAVKMLLQVFFTESALGYCKQIKITLHKDRSVSIRGFDRGIILNEKVIDSKPLWYYDICELGRPCTKVDELCFQTDFSKHSDLFGKAEERENDFVPDEEQGFDLCCVQYACEFMTVISVRDGQKKTLTFSKGYSTSELIKEPTTEQDGTYFRFKLDEDVFEDISLPISSIKGILKDAAIVTAGLKIQLFDETTNTEEEYLFPSGVSDYASSAKVSDIPLFDKELYAVGKDRYDRPEYTAKVRILLGFAQKSTVDCFHNGKRLSFGGSHLSAVKEKLVSRISGRVLEEDEISFEDIQKNILIVLVTNSTKTYWENAAQTAIANKLITDMAVDLIDDDFLYYLKQNKEKIKELLS